MKAYDDYLLCLTHFVRSTLVKLRRRHQMPKNNFGRFVTDMLNFRKYPLHLLPKVWSIIKDYWRRKGETDLSAAIEKKLFGKQDKQGGGISMGLLAYGLSAGTNPRKKQQNIPCRAEGCDDQKENLSAF